MSAIADETSSITCHLNDENKPEEAPADSGEEEEDGEIYEVERILEDKTKKGVRVFLVRWKGYGSDEDSWEPEDNLDGAKEVLSVYMANLENKKSKPGSSKRPKAKKGKKEPARTSNRYKEDSENENDDAVSKDSDDEFGPNKKRGRKQPTGGSTKVLRDSTKPATADTPTNNVDRVVARRKNISKNMRWITESSDESGEGSDDDDGVKPIVNPAPTPLSIHPDSSTDVGKSEPSAKTSNGNNRASLKLRITKDHDSGDVTADRQTLKIAPAAVNEKNGDGGDAIEKATSAKSSSNKKTQKRTIAETENGHPDDSNNPKVTFTGVYRDVSGEIRYIAVDCKTKKRDDLCLAGAFMADGWSLCRFLSSKIRFSHDGDVFADGDGHV